MHSARVHPLLVCAASEQLGLFTARQALAAGYSYGEITAAVRGGRWTRVRRSVFIAKERLELADARERHLQIVYADCLSLAALPAAVSHQSAALALGLPMLDAIEELTPAVTVPPGSHSATACSHVYRATLAAWQVWHRAPFLLTSPARTIVDLARSRSFSSAVVSADAALREEMTTAEQLERILGFCDGWPGAGRATRVLQFADGRSESVYESLARVRCAEHGLPAPQLQAALQGADGHTYWVDLYWLEARTIGEVDGRTKYQRRPGNDPERVLWDEKLREDTLREAGYQMVRMTAAQIEHNFGSVVARLHGAFARGRRSAA